MASPLGHATEEKEEEEEDDDDEDITWLWFLDVVSFSSHLPHNTSVVLIRR